MQNQKIKAANLILSDGNFKKKLNIIEIRLAIWIFPMNHFNRKGVNCGFKQTETFFSILLMHPAPVCLCR